MIYCELLTLTRNNFVN